MSYNCKEFLREAILSLSHVDAAFEVIVVDNNSSDGTQEQIPLQFPGITFIANQHNAGFSAANNQAFAKSSGEYILLLNPDAKLINTDIDKALQYLETHPTTLIGPILLNTDGSVQDSVFRIAGVISIFLEAFFISYLFSAETETILKTEKYGLSGACLIMHRNVYQQLGGLDEELFWMEDIDFCVRAKKIGYTLLYFREWKLVHHVGQSEKKNYKVAIANQLISKLKYLKKHKSVIETVLAGIFIQVHILLRIVVFAVLSPFKKLYKHKLFAYLHSQTLFFKYIFTSKKQTF